MNYIATKSFCFAGDQYSAGMVFGPSKYPHVCTIRKLQSLLSGRFIKEDFKLPNWAPPVKEAVLEENTEPAPVKEAAHAQNTVQDASSGTISEKPKRTKGPE